jgi:hypothetical protein
MKTMKKLPREPLALNEPIRKKKPMPREAAPAAPKERVRPPSLSSDSGTVRVFRPSPPTPPPRPLDVEVAHRKLIRTTMEDVRRRQAEGKLKLSEKATSSPVRGQHAPDQTNQEFQYLTELVQSKATIRVKLTNGDTVEGWIEYIDKNFIRLTRRGRPNLFLFKNDIRYLCEVKAPEKSTPAKS